MRNTIDNNSFEFINNILNLLILVSIIILFYLSIIKKITNLEKFSDENKKNTDDPMNTALVLTTCVNAKKNFMTKSFSEDVEKEIENDLKERVNLYKNVIDKYLERTNLTIHVIESSGSNALGEIYKDNSRVKYYTFKLDNPYFFYNIYNESTTAYEAYSILNAYENFNLSKYSKVLKITGRYFVPNIKDIINSLKEEADIYVQNTVYHDSLSQRCEIIGMKSYLCPGLMVSVIKKREIMERFLYDLYYEHEENQNPPYIAQRIDLIKLEEPVKRGGDGQTIEEL